MDILLRARVRQATWLFLIFAYIVAFIGGVYGVSTRPSVGADFEVSGSELVITDFKPGSNLWIEGARVGDVVELINGSSAVTAYESGSKIDHLSYRSADSSPGDPLTKVDVVVPPTSLVNAAISLNLLGLAFAVMAVLIYLRAKRSSETVLFALMAMSAATTLAIGPSAAQIWGSVAMDTSIYVGSTMFLAFFISFTLSDSERSDWLKTWLPELTIGVSVLMVAAWILTAAGLVDLYPILQPGGLILLAGAFLGAVGLLIYRLRTADRESQEQLRVVTLGTVIGLVPFFWLTAIPLIVTGKEILTGEVSVLGLVLIPVSFGYAIAKHDLMGIRRLFHRGAAYAIISAAIIVVYGTILTGLNLLAPDSEALGPIQGALLVLMFAGAPMLSSVRRSALRLVDRVLYEGAVTQEDLVSAISTVSANETETERVLERAMSYTGQGFDVEYAVFIAFNEIETTIEHAYNRPDSEVLEAIRKIQKQDSRGARRSVLPGTDQSILIGTLREVGRKSRAIVLGPKVSGDVFTDEEVSLLETVTAVVSTALTRIRLLDEVQEQSQQLKNMGTEMQNIQETERQEISSYLHDEPLQKLAYVNSRVRELDVSDDLKKLLDDVVRDLRGTSASLSPEMLREHGLLAALKWMVKEQQERGPFRVFFGVKGLNEGERLSDDVELTIYRAVQEALNNCRKHAEAKSVWVKLERSSSELELAVEDNGIGIKATTGDAEERSVDQGLGLRGLKQRITNLGGSLAILPRASRGTAFIVKIPAVAAEIGAAS